MRSLPLCTGRCKWSTNCWISPRLDEGVGEFDGVGSGEADAVDTRHRRHVVQQQGEVGDVAVRHGAAVGVDVLPQQIHLAHALLGQGGDLGDHVFQRPAHFLTARIGHHAESAVFAATLHHRHKGFRPFRARLRQAIEFLDFRESHVHHGAALLLHLVQHGRQAVQGLRAEHHVHVRRPLAQGSPFLAGDAAADADDHAGAFFLQGAPAAQLGEDFLLGSLAHGTGVEQQHVGLGRIVGQLQIMGFAEQIPQLGGIVLVHLAAVGLDE